jgi:hypothetical protein
MKRTIFKRRRFFKRRLFRRKRTTRSGLVVPRLRHFSNYHGNYANLILNTYQPGAVIAGATFTVNNLAFTLGSFLTPIAGTQTLGFVNAFNSFRIDKIKVQLIPNVTEVPYPQATLNQQAAVVSVVNRTSTNQSFTNMAEALNASTARRHNWLRNFQRTFKPVVPEAAYLVPGTPAAGGIDKYSPWLEMNATNQGVNHYGVSICTAGAPTAVNVQYTQVTKIWLTLRDRSF